MQDYTDKVIESLLTKFFDDSAETPFPGLPDEFFFYAMYVLKDRSLSRILNSDTAAENPDGSIAEVEDESTEAQIRCLRKVSGLRR